MRTLLVTLLITFYLGQDAFSQQKYTVRDVKRAYSNSLSPFYQEDEVAGYYFFTFSDRTDNKDWYYKLTILDAELNKLVSKSIRVDKRTLFLGAASQDNALLLKMYEPKEKFVTYKVIDFEGKTVSTERREPNKFERKVISGMTWDGTMSTTSIYNRGNAGFIDFVNNDKSAYEVLGLDSEAEEVWRYSVPEPKGVRTSTVMATSDDYTVLLETSAKNRSTKDFNYKLICLDANGKETFEWELEDTKRSLVPFSIDITDSGENLFVSGEYYDAGDKVGKAESKGLFFMNMDMNGKVLKSSFAGWEEDIKPLYDNGKKLLRNSLYFHSITELSDGRIIAVAEEYKKQVSAGGIAAKALAASSGSVSTNAGLLEIKIGNILIFTLDGDFEVKQVDVIEKNPNTVNLGDEGVGLMSKHLLAKKINAIGGFDYKFFQTTNEKDFLSIIYIDSEKEKGKILKRPKVNSVTYTVGTPKPARDKIDIEFQVFKTMVNTYMPSSGDFLVLAQYVPKDKIIYVIKEKMNVTKTE